MATRSPGAKRMFSATTRAGEAPAVMMTRSGSMTTP